MAQDLPDDVWREVVEIPFLDRRALHNLSLASRRMHRLVVPVLFRCLEFHRHLLMRANFKSLMTMLIRAKMRARFLFNSPDLLRHTRVFTLWGNPYTVDSIAKYLVLHEDSGDSSSRDDAENLLAVIHDAILSLIFRMPGLRELHIRGIVMTPLCYTAISSRPLLTTLNLRPRHLPDIAHIAPELPNALRLRDFNYEYDLWTSNDQPPPFLTDILDHCILGLERLTVSFILFPLVVARIPLHHTLSLRSLSVRSPLYEDLTVAAFFQVLRACPQLRHLEICDDGFPDVEPTHYLLPLSLPYLSTISGPPCLLQLVTGGTNIVNVSILETFQVKKQSLTQVILSSPTHLRDLSMRRVTISQTARELLTFIQSLAVFQNLESLTIFYEFDTSWADQLSWEDHTSWVDELAWENHVSAQESHSTIKDLLSQLVRLRFLKIQSNDIVGGYDIGCPISKPGEPADRGHPSLEGIYVDFICGMWSWDSRTGWEERNWAVQ